MSLIIRHHCRKIFERLNWSPSKISLKLKSPAADFLSHYRTIHQMKYSSHSSHISFQLLPKCKSKRGVFGWLMAFSLAEFIGAKDTEPTEVKKIMNKAKKILEVIS